MKICYSCNASIPQLTTYCRVLLLTFVDEKKIYDKCVCHLCEKCKDELIQNHNTNEKLKLENIKAEKKDIQDNEKVE